MRSPIAYTIRLVSVGVVIPLVMSFVAYFGFTTNYTQGLFSHTGFEAQAHGGVYKYRVLGSRLLLATHAFVHEHHVPAYAPKALKTLDAVGDAEFYSAYFYLNTVLLCAICLLLFTLFSDGSRDFFRCDLVVLFICALITMTEFVVTAYDVLSYLFLTLAAFMVIRTGARSAIERALLVVVIILATATRESAALILSFYFAVNHRMVLKFPNRGGLNREQQTLLLLLLGFLATYISLRLWLGFDQAVYRDSQLTANLSLLPLMGLSFFVAIVASILLSAGMQRESVVFVIAAIPYIAAMILVANMWELRLWTPVLMLLLILRSLGYRLPV